MSMAGFGLAAISFMIGIFYVIQKIMGVDITPGLSTTILVVSFFSGVQLLGLGLVGEYIGRIYDETKRRPMYIVDRKVNFSGPVGQSARHVREECSAGVLKERL
jgi:dolichol-phosphate mannosyltransferase